MEGYLGMHITSIISNPYNDANEVLHYHPNENTWGSRS